MLSSSMLEEKRDNIINRRNNNTATAAASTTNNNLAPPKHGDAAGTGGGNGGAGGAGGARGADAGRWATGAGGGYRRTASHDVVGPLGGAAAAARARFGSPEDDLRGPFNFSYEYTGTTMQDIRN